ncbi:MAG TPA: histidine--tRNA ligase [Clostridia bacterium]
MMISIPKGTKDILPDQSFKWQFVESIARKITRLYNLKEIRTPIFEHTELFERSVGETTDIVNKEMYTFLDKGGRSITLKPEGTAGVARAFIESLSNSTLPVKMYYITPAFRYERPQAGRLRQFHQFGVEVFGAAGAEMDAEVITLAKDFLEAVGMNSLKLEINSIGSGEARKNYNKILKEYLTQNADKLCPVCQTRIEKNPLRVLDCKLASCKSVLADAPKTIDYLSEEDKAHFERLKSILDDNNIKYTVNPYLVRGLDYYTKTVFEFIPQTVNSAQETICGGGRYDNLIESLGGKPTPAVGFGLGLERLLLAIENAGINIEDANKLETFVAYADAELVDEAIKLVGELRKAGISADYDQTGRSLKAQLKYADKQGAQFCVTIGGDELKSGVYPIKNMRNGNTLQVARQNIIETILKELK